jgi:hypothetical protein
MRSKEDLIKRMRSDPYYKRALTLARTDEERKRVIALAEQYASSIAEAVLPLIDSIKRDPALAQQLGLALAEGSSVISSSQATSGSTG